MKERPILFSSPMVTAILSGAKTQTRRVVKIDGEWAVIRPMQKIEPCIDGEPQNFPGADDNSWLALKDERGIADYGYGCISCPYGKVGDRLWVREAFRELGSHQKVDGKLPWRGSPEICVYRADDPHEGPFRSSIHMPRWASRITLEITDVRVERLMEISADDVIAEGVGLAFSKFKTFSVKTDRQAWECGTLQMFAQLWDKLNGKKHPWDSNPWVWVVEFKRV